MFNETVNEAWKLRYGTEANLDLQSHFLNHRSVRRFSEQTIAEDTLRFLLAAAQSAATSSNLQSWSGMRISDPALRKVVAESCGSQKQILTAPEFFVFLADLNRIQQYSIMAGVNPDGLGTAEMYTVAVIDAALAAERMVCAAESAGLGTCYIGAMRNHPDRIKQALALPEKTFALFGLCIGYPSENANATIKPRLSQDQVWFENAYPFALSSEEYDSRMNDFYESQGMDSSESFSKKSGQRVQKSGLSGREHLLMRLHEQELMTE
jgi:nitroreductase